MITKSLYRPITAAFIVATLQTYFLAATTGAMLNAVIFLLSFSLLVDTKLGSQPSSFVPENVYEQITPYLSRAAIPADIVAAPFLVMGLVSCIPRARTFNKCKCQVFRRHRVAETMATLAAAIEGALVGCFVGSLGNMFRQALRAKFRSEVEH